MTPSPLPQGTVTFLFTDVEGSTALWERAPDAMRAALADHDAIMRTAIELEDGYVFSTAGDAFAAAFARPDAAARAAVFAQRALHAHPWPESAVVRVRMGLHTGTAHERDGDYFGPSVNRAARIMAAGHGGQVVLSRACADLLQDQLADGIAFVDLGEHPLSGLARAERLVQLTVTGLPDRFPPLRTARRAVGNLSNGVTKFVGRRSETQRLVAELGDRRLVTLTGPGGVGKTRLAVEAARSIADEYADGVWLCELAPVTDGGQVGHAVMSTLSIRPQPGTSNVDSVIDALGDRQLLLVLDNCEHVVDEVAQLCARIMSTCGGVTLLATSREPLGSPGERVMGVPPLPTDAAVALFIDRATAAEPASAAGNAAAIEEVCRRLDGIPLAIELAAARAATMTLTELVERLDDRFRLLRRGRRGALERHQTMQAAVQWSYDLLAPDEQVLFERITCFAGGFDLRSAEEVGSCEKVARADVADLLANLVDKSMVVADRMGPRTRYGLLETLRQFGQERLATGAYATAALDRHLHHFVVLARRAALQVKSQEYPQGMALFEAEWDNLRAALRWAVQRDEATSAESLLGSVAMFALWRQRHDVREWAEEVMTLSGAGPLSYGVASKFAWLSGELSRAIELARLGVDTASSEGDEGLRVCLDALGRSLWYSGETTEGWAVLQQYATMFDPVSEPFDSAWALFALCGFAQANNAALLPELVERAESIARPLANPGLETMAGLCRGWEASSVGRYDKARSHLQRAIASAEHAGDRYISGFLRVQLAILVATTRVGEVAPALHDAIAHLYETRSWVNVWSCVETAARYWAWPDRPEVAAVLVGYLRANGIRTAGPGYRRDSYRRDCDELFAAVAVEERLRDAMEKGAVMGRSELVAYVLSALEAEGTLRYGP